MRSSSRDRNLRVGVSICPGRNPLVLGRIYGWYCRYSVWFGDGVESQPISSPRFCPHDHLKGFRNGEQLDYQHTIGCLQSDRRMSLSQKIDACRASDTGLSTDCRPICHHFAPCQLACAICAPTLYLLPNTPSTSSPASTSQASTDSNSKVAIQQSERISTHHLLPPYHHRRPRLASPFSHTLTTSNTCRHPLLLPLQ